MVVESIDYEKCTDCGICMNVCPLDVFRQLGKTYYIAYRDDCMTCFLCEIYCPEQCIYVGPDRARPVPPPYLVGAR